MAKVEAAGHPVIELAIPVLLTPEELLGRLGSAEAAVCHLTVRVDERVLSHPALRGAGPPRGSVTLRTRKRLPLLAVEGPLRPFG
jgi:hypothetical protein